MSEMRREISMSETLDTLARAMHEAWMAGFVDGVASKGGPGGIMGAASAWDTLPPAARERHGAIAADVVARLESEGAVLVPSRVVDVLQAIAATVPESGGGPDARAVVARVADMLEVCRHDLARFQKGKESCSDQTSSAHWKAPSRAMTTSGAL